MEPSGAVARGYYSGAGSPPAPVVPLRSARPLAGGGSRWRLRWTQASRARSSWLSRSASSSALREGGEGFGPGRGRLPRRAEGFKGVVELGGPRLPCDTYATIFARGSLACRELLNKFETVLDAPRGAAALEAGHR
ncbi:MAG: hypothetical protein QXV98_03010 [Thermofilaceae archaeon]